MFHRERHASLSALSGVEGSPSPTSRRTSSATSASSRISATLSPRRLASLFSTLSFRDAAKSPNTSTSPIHASHARAKSQGGQDAKALAKAAKAAKKAEKENSKRIDAMLAASQEKEKKVVTFLLLGPGESGKSTLFKQIRKNYGSGFTLLDRRKHHVIIIQNVLRAIKSLLYHSERLLQRMPFSNLNNTWNAATTAVSPSLAESKAFIEHANLYKIFEGHYETNEEGDTTNAATGGATATGYAGGAGGGIVKLNVSGKFVPQLLNKGADGRSASEIFTEILSHCYLLWRDPGLRCTFENRAHFDFHQLYDSDAYFLNRLASGELLNPEYIPSEEDLIRVRIRTTAINQIEFHMNLDGKGAGEGESGDASKRIPMRMLDVAGQRSERKKWIPYFSDATAVLFVAAISEYDQVLAEDGCTNRLIESINLFTEILNSHWFKRTPIVLFLNKCDLFSEKIKRVPLNILFPKYRPPPASAPHAQHYTTACEFLCREFVKRRADPNKVIHIHVVSAVQVNLIKTAMESVKKMIIEQSLEMAGLV